MKRLAILLSCIIVFLTSCSSQAADNRLAAGSFVFNERNYPVISVTESTLNILESINYAVLGENNKIKNKIIVNQSTDQCYKDIIEGKSNIAIAHEISEEMSEQIKYKDNLEVFEIGTDKLVFYTNETKPCDINFEALEKIYSGEITNWNDLGGKDLPISVFINETGTASQNAAAKIFNILDEIKPIKKKIQTDKGEYSVLMNFSSQPGSIGYGLLSEADGISANILEIDGINPESENYRLKIPVYIIIKKTDNKTLPEVILYNWICSEQGLSVIDKSY